MPRTGIGPEQGWAAIHDAARRDDLEALTACVEAKQGMPPRDLDMPSSSGLTPLHVAAMCGSNLCIAYLIGRGADWRLLDDMGRSALHWAADGGHTESIMHLVAAGQGTNLLDKEGNAPLHIAARKGNTEVCKYLVEIGADLSCRNARGWTPLQVRFPPRFACTGDWPWSLDAWDRVVCCLLASSTCPPRRYRLFFLRLLSVHASSRNAHPPSMHFPLLQTATVPIYRVAIETLEKWIPHVNQIRRDFDDKLLTKFLAETGFERYVPLFRRAHYSHHHLFCSAREVSMQVPPPLVLSGHAASLTTY